MGEYTLNKNMIQDWDSLLKAIKEAWGEKPNKVAGQLTSRTMYYQWVLLNKIKGAIEIECPDDWDKDYILDTLLLQGRICLTDTTAGVLPLECQPYGQNVFRRPCDVNIANPVIGSFSRKIDVDCVLIYLFDTKYFRGYDETIRIHAQKLANCDSAIDVNLINTKVAYVFDCADKKQADEAKLIYDKITSGEPAVFYRSSSGMNLQDKMQFFKNDVKNVYICDLVQKEKRAIINEFLTQVGINNAAEEKKERLLVDEVNSNNDELVINIKYAYDNIKKGVEKVHKMFPDVKFDIKMPFIDRMNEKSEMALKEMKEGADHNESDRPDGDMGDKEPKGKSDGDVTDR